MDMPKTLEAAPKAAAQPKVKNAGTVGWLQQCIHRGRNEIFSEVKTVTPALAEIILSQNHENRRIRPYKLAQIVSDMTNGRWQLNGEAIVIAKTGELNDGQHRLMGIVDSKTPQPLLFVFGVERETRTTLDQGAARSANDYLQMDGVPNAATLASLTRTILSFERADKRSLGRSGEITASQVLERAEQDQTLQTSARYASAHAYRMKKFCSPTVLGFCHNVLIKENASDGIAFMHALVTGEDLKRGDAVYTARERLLGFDRGKTMAVQIEIIFRAWNAYRERRPMKTIPLHGRLPELV
jgi:hypothetical protein